MMHLGPRVTALVDGQLPSAEEERAWAHVHACELCRTAVEREGWIKRQVAALSLSGDEGAPAYLKGSLCRPAAYPGSVLDEPWPLAGTARDLRTRRLGSLAALGAGSVGAAMIGVIALGAAPAEAPGDRQAPLSSLDTRPGSPAVAPGASEREVAEGIRTVVSALRLGR